MWEEIYYFIKINSGTLAEPAEQICRALKEFIVQVLGRMRGWEISRIY